MREHSCFERKNRLDCLRFVQASKTIYKPLNLVALLIYCFISMVNEYFCTGLENYFDGMATFVF